ncbi:LANO_0B06414g1_1 [Lachancea nothofagi CBS 11611]|uniref:LANO_0B06414g1_1 n=1 Tax=Lachancea nothofagi CBS 11611 TaxID=1266666 RepID=A0A1G4IZF2_9SACH|nr:LANO_0B06414g1_1 [Lachancea nothofagi CBS 11611]
MLNAIKIAGHRRVIGSVGWRSFKRCLNTNNPSEINNQYLNRKRSSFSAGQPLFETRPELLKPGELTPGITALEYFNRRVKLATRLPAKSCAIIAGAQVKYASGPVFYAFQQNNDLFYLTGWNEPDSVMILEKPSDNIDDVIFHLVVPPKDAFSEQWEGERTGTEGACEIFNADESTDTRQSSVYISKIINRNDHIYFDRPQDKIDSSAEAFFRSFFSVSHSPASADTITDAIKNSGKKYVRKLKSIIADMRSIKSPAEIRVMRRAGQISGRAYNQAYARRFRNERTLHSFLDYKFVSGGCDKSAYIPVVASGSNSLCIHYTRNDDVMYDDEMVLVDASGSLGGYCTDISRTWPVNGTFSPAQRDLYEAVLNVQRKCIELCKASGLYSLHDIHEKSIAFFKEELKNVGLPASQNSDVSKIYPHYIGHNLGLDVHDVPQISRYAPLQEGQVITIEPGIYIPDDPKYPPYFRNIGIRIEDDIAVGADGYTNLTVEAAKEIVDIENIAQNGVTSKFEDDVVAPLKYSS